MNYISYQCSVCRRKKDLPEDSQRALLNHCTITKGCSGRLFAVGESSTLTTTPPVAGLQDWYARGTEFVTRPVSSTETIDLSTSANGALTLALFLTEAERTSIGTSITATFAARRVDNISFTQFNYRINTAGQTVVSGADQTGVTMRFDQPAIDEDRVYVRVNGVTKFITTDYTLTPNTVTFLTGLAVGDQVSVSVFSQQNVTTHTVIFTRNDAYTGIDVTAWKNVEYAEAGVFDGTDDARARYVLWTADEQQFTALGVSNRLRLLSMGALTTPQLAAKGFFMLAKSPYGPPDRQLSFTVSCGALNEQFLLQVSSTETGKMLLADQAALREFFPPFQLLFEPQPLASTFGISYLDPTAEFSTAAASSAIVTDTTQTSLTGRVIGPV